VGEYVVPLSLLLQPASVPLEKLPVLSFAMDGVGVRRLRETWNDTHYVVTGEAVLREDTPIDMKIWELLIGHGSGGDSVFRFELAVARMSIASLIVANGEELLGVSESELASEDVKFQAFWRADGPSPTFRLAIHDLTGRLRLRDYFKKGRLIEEAGAVVGIEMIDPEERVDIELISASFTVDTERGVSIDLDPEQAIEIPPLLLGYTDVGLQIEKLKIDWSDETGIPEVLSRPNLDESWKGVYIDKARLFNLDNWFPILPKMVDLKSWLIGSDGVTGTTEFTPPDGVGVLGPFKLNTFTLELERSHFVRGVFDLTFHWGAIRDEWEDWHDLLLTFTLRENPGLTTGAIGFEIAVRSSVDDPDGLFTITREMIAVTEGTLGAALLAALWLDSDPEPSIDQAMIATLLLIASFLQAEDKLTIEELKITKITGRYFTEEINGHPVRFVDFVVDARARISLDIPLDVIPVLGLFLPHIKTDRPIGLEIRGFTVRLALNLGKFPEADVDHVKTVDVVFDSNSGISFDVGEQTLLEDSPFLIVKAGFGRWDKGVWFDLGVKYAKDTSKLAVSVIPSVVRLWFLSDGSFDHVSFEGLSFSLLIPPSVYVKGRLEWGEDVRLGTGRAFILRKNPAAKFEERVNWVWDLELALREETRESVTSVAGSLEMTNSSGWPLSGSMSLYGVSALLGVNSRPAVLDPETPDYVQWYREQPPANRIIATKWALEDGSEAAAFGVVIGSADGGRAWSAKVAIVYASGVLIIPGTLNVLSKRPKLADSGKGTFDMVLVADWDHDIYAASIRFDYRKPEDGKLVHVHVPLDFYTRGQAPKTWHLWVGEHMPVAKRVGLKVLDKFDGSFYFMLDRENIANLGGSGINVPGTAKTLGGAAAFKWQIGKGRVKLFFRAGLEFHIAFGDVPNSGDAAADTDRTFFGGLIRILGAFGVKVFGMGFEFHINADMIWMTPEPSFFDLAVTVKIGLPWPIPDIKVTVHAKKGADGPLVEPGKLVSGLTLHPRAKNAPIELDESVVHIGVPIDPALTLTFAHPVRNATASLGSFNFNSINTSTDWPMSGGKGYAVELAELTLFKEEGAVRTPVAGPFPALWIDGNDPAPGGGASRTMLQLFAYDGVMTSRYIGATADYVQGLFEEFDPCRKKPPSPVCYRFAELPLGVITHSLSVAAPPDERPMTVAVIEAPPGADTVRRFASLSASAAVVADMVVIPDRVIMLPATHGATLPGPDAAPLAADRLDVRWPRARTAELSVLRIPRDSRVVVRFFDGTRLVREDVEGVVVGMILDKIEDVRFRCDVPTTHAEMMAFQHLNVGQEARSQNVLYRVCLTYEDDVRAWEDGLATAGAWSHFWSDLYDSNAATSDALLLEPGTRYAVEARLRWFQVEGTTETPGGERTHTFRFETVPPTQPPLDRLRDAKQLVDSVSWDIDTTPADGADTHYRDRGIGMRLRDPRLDAVYKAFGRRLVLRVVDDRGDDLFDRLAFLAAHASEMPEYQQVWRDIVLGVRCADGRFESLWSIGTAHFGSLLERNRGYEASLIPVPDPDGTVDLSTVDWAPLTAIHSFRFRTSRWDNLAAHAAAHAILDEIVDGSPDLGEIGSPPARAWDDTALEDTLHTRLGAPPRTPATAPEIVRLWRKEGSDEAPTYSVVGLLIEGPEPLVKPTTSISVRDELSAPVPVAIIAAESGTRALWLFRTTDGVGPSPSGVLTIAVDDGVENARFTVAVGATPEFLVEEMAP
jgi:hypothetical protein